MPRISRLFVIAGFLSIACILIGYGVLELMNSRSFQLFGGIVTKVHTSEKVVALTFDDGPGQNTDEILRILDEHGVKATFFLTGREIEENLTDAERIAQKGHEIGNHSYSHQRMVFKSPSFIREEIEKTDELIRRAGYTGPIQFRPPYSKKLVFLPYYLFQHGRQAIFMNIEPESYPEVALEARRIVEHVQENIEPGSIILLHVMYENRGESLASVEGIISSLQEMGYSFKTISELLMYASEELSAKDVHHTMSLIN